MFHYSSASSVDNLFPASRVWYAQLCPSWFLRKNGTYKAAVYGGERNPCEYEDGACVSVLSTAHSQVKARENEQILNLVLLSVSRESSRTQCATTEKSAHITNLSQSSGLKNKKQKTKKPQTFVHIFMQTA